MNVTFMINDENKALLAYDQALTFEPAWVECRQGKSGIRIIGEDGTELPAGELSSAHDARMQNVETILVVHMNNGQAVEGFIMPFINQTYEQ